VIDGVTVTEGVAVGVGNPNVKSQSNPHGTHSSHLSKYKLLGINDRSVGCAKVITDGSVIS
jgi:hypothetical protein